MLSTDTDTPPMAETTVGSDFLHAFHIVSEFGVNVLGKNVAVLARFEILLTVQEPQGDLELTGILDNGHHLFNLVGRQLSGPFVEINLGLFANQIRHAATQTLDLGQGKHHIALTLHIGIQNTQNVLEFRSLHQRRRPATNK